jgi:Ca2+-binding RTX toxin-like protein
VPEEFPSLADAVAAASAADTISISAAYAGNVTVTVTVENLLFDAPASVSGIRLNAGPGVETIRLAGDSSIAVFGNSLDNVFVGNAGNNIMVAGDGNDHVSGGDGSDDLYGDGGDDLLEGGNGYDRLIGGWGNDTLDGGAGIDAAIYEDSATGVSVNLLTGVASDGLWGTDTLIDIEAVHGSRYADTIQMSNTSGGYVYGRAGDDTIIGGTGNDEIYGGSGADTIDGGAGNDTVSYLDDGYDSAGAGWRGVYVELAPGLATDNWGNIDTLTNIENASGSNMADTLAGNAGSNILNGHGGDDTFYGEDGDDFIYGGDGNDWMFGGADNDQLNGGAGNDTIDGGDGHDYVTYENAAGSVTVNLLAGTASDGLGGTDTIANVESAIGGQFADTLTLSNVSGKAYGRAGADLLTGGTGNDELNGGSGNDTINGGLGNDTANYFDDAADAAGAGFQGVYVDLQAGTATDNWGNTDTLIGIENATGSSLTDTLYGSSGANILTGGAGSDWVYGRDGDDWLIGGSGNDYLDGGNGLDLISYEDSTGAANVNLLTGTASDGMGGTDTLVGIEGVQAGRFGDAVQLGNGGHFGAGRAGDDTITGGTGADVLNGGSGNDTLNGAGGNDLVTYIDDGSDTAGWGFQGATVNLATGTATDNWGNTDTLISIENALGSNMADTLKGNSVSNMLNGLGGNDRIDGKGGADTLFGGAGADAFVFSTALGGGNVDTLADFASGTDSIELSQSVFSALGTGTLSTTAFVQGVAATTANQHVIYNSSTGVVSYDADGNGSGAAVAFAVVQPGSAMSASDFRIV